MMMMMMMTAGRQFRAAIKEVGFHVLEGEEGEADAVIAKIFRDNTTSTKYRAILGQDSDFFMYSGVQYIPFKHISFGNSRGKHCVTVGVLIGWHIYGGVGRS